MCTNLVQILNLHEGSQCSCSSYKAIHIGVLQYAAVCMPEDDFLPPEHKAAALLSQQLLIWRTQLAPCRMCIAVSQESILQEAG